MNSEALNNFNGPSNWFELATARIKDIKALSDDIRLNIEQLANESLVAAESLFFIIIGAVTILIVFVVFLTIQIGKSVTNRVTNIKLYLESISRERDLPQR